MNVWVKIVFGFLLVCRSAPAQGFINLNFESAKIIPTSPYSIDATNALPGWTVLLGGDQVSLIAYNNPAVGGTSVSIWATNGAQISGRCSVFLQGGFYYFNPPTAAISQTGLIPISSISLFFEAQPGPGALDVSLDGQNLNFFAVGTGANYTLYGADISAFAGQIETLEFSAQQDLDRYNGWTIDNIQFSPSPVPEPDVLGLSAMGGLFLAWRRGRRYFQA
jgi:hypothetical protein